MSAAPLESLDRLCIHTITTKPWSLKEAVEAYAAAGVGGITVWRDAVPEGEQVASGKLIRDAGLDIVSYCRGGFFPHLEADGRAAAIADNRKMIDEAASLGAPLIVLVCGAAVGQTLETSRQQIQDGIAALLPDLERTGVKLGIEPLHPMYADTRSAVNTLGQANDIAEAINHPQVGIAADVYHLWWDPDLEAEIARCGREDHLFAFHICDWRVPTEDLLLDRGLMGEGCIDIRKIRGWVEAAGFTGYNEVEVFSERHWKRDQGDFLADIIEAYQTAS